ncbi:M42 family metallopeptidase [Paenibacillus lignilyticus]|uniref:M42 family metallopeptidase n=1 Tax=Paenibacillus lignilyticus TaxID=1172615 RepID=A0ABS5CIK1_9BACL|nr:M42 family metallopeptidase [Paenibacillus lignilyticus]MBP3965671.1 M42 family metallopeptidase [Paenibacillus lignilyticus]
MNQETMELMRTLTEFQAASGFERELRSFVRGELTKYTDEIVQDRLGSIFGVMRGDESGPVIMAAGHLDEVGFMITGITENGMLKFQTLGGWFSQVLPAQRIQVMTENGPIVGIIGTTPVHLLDEAARGKPLDVKGMYIDIGADSRQHAEEVGVRIGQQAVPYCPFTPLANPKKIMAKSWDNRYGVGLAIELLKELRGQKLPNVLYAGATVQEELGLRGAKTASAMIKPDLFFAMDASAANDMNGDKSAFGQLGQGTLLRLYDPSMLTHRGMVEYVLDMAQTHNIPYQYFVSQGGTDAGAVHTQGIGIPSTVIGVCARYIHTSASVLHTDDYDAAKELLVKLVQHCDRSTYQTIIDRS